MSSVSSKILASLVGRLNAINGAGLYNFDMRGRVFRCRPRWDLVGDKLAIFVSRRAGGDAREQKPGPQSPISDVTTIYDVIGVAPELEPGAEEGEVLERLLEDIQRALEIDSDRYMLDSETGNNLLCDELILVDGEARLPEAWEDVERICVGVRCMHQHVYGRPEVVTK